MLSILDLEEISCARLFDAKILYASGRFDGAYYLAGYSLELALKARICKTLNWTEFPTTNKEFERFRSFKVHDLEVLLKLSGFEPAIKSKYLPEWSKVKTWQPEIRYHPVGFANQKQASDMLDAISMLIGEAMNALIEKMKRVELSISSELGPFELFALFQPDTTLRLWDILIAAEWVERDELAAMRLIANQMNKEFTAHEIVRFSGFVVIPLAYEGLRKFQSQVDVEHGERELRNVTFFDVPILHAYIITSHHTGNTRMINRPTRVKQN